MPNIFMGQAAYRKHAGPLKDRQHDQVNARPVRKQFWAGVLRLWVESALFVP